MTDLTLALENLITRWSAAQLTARARAAGFLPPEDVILSPEQHGIGLTALAAAMAADLIRATGAAGRALTGAQQALGHALAIAQDAGDPAAEKLADALDGVRKAEEAMR